MQWYKKKKKERYDSLKGYSRLPKSWPIKKKRKTIIKTKWAFAIDLKDNAWKCFDFFSVYQSMSLTIGWIWQLIRRHYITLDIGNKLKLKKSLFAYFYSIVFNRVFKGNRLVKWSFTPKTYKHISRSLDDESSVALKREWSYSYTNRKLTCRAILLIRSVVAIYRPVALFR